MFEKAGIELTGNVWYQSPRDVLTVYSMFFNFHVW